MLGSLNLESNNMKNKSIGLTASQLIEAMKRVVEAPGYPYLKSYKDDFYKHDCIAIQETYGHGVRYLWVVNPYGTHLTRIGVHPRQNEWAVATMESGLRAYDIGVALYLISESGVRQITEQQARCELARWDYACSNANVRDSKGQLLAVWDVEPFRKPSDGDQYCKVAFQSPRLQFMSHSDLLALRDIAVCEGIKAWQSFFVRLDTITVNGMDLSELIVAAKGTSTGEPLSELPEEQHDAESICI